ncbi:MAG: hypothetical protein PHC68_12510 [Syntrophorhabdaceae bacterium]|nr:hypothetical protein [Syntrophorhabdaceae bacterium]
MYLSLGVLMDMNVTLSRGLHGKNPYTGEICRPVGELPVGIFRHLRRLYRAVIGELEIVEPDRKVFADKWIVDGKWPNSEAENFSEFLPAYNEFFGKPDIILPFATPFQLDLIKPETVVPVDIMNLMENVNDTIADEAKQNENPPATVVNDNGASTPKADA